MDGSADGWCDAAGALAADAQSAAPAGHSQSAVAPRDAQSAGSAGAGGRKRQAAPMSRVPV
jgi:hypothetical protein